MLISARGAELTFVDSTSVHVLDIADARPAALLRRINARPRQTRAAWVRGYLDSLGYFSARWDTASGDTILVVAGPRAVIDTATTVSAQLPLLIDSPARLRWPVPYNAGMVKALADKMVRYAAARGFPFASVSVNIEGDSAHVAVIFTLHADRYAVFGSPRYTGSYKTRDRLLGYDMSFRAGDEFSLPLLEDSRMRLLSRNYIEDVATGEPAVISAQSPDQDTTDVVAVPILIHDRSGLGLDGALGFESEREARNRLSGVLTLTLLNAFRWGESATLYYRGEQTYNKMEIGIAKPHLFRQRLVGSMGFGLEIEQERYGYLHGEARLLFEPRTSWQTGLAVSTHETSDETLDSLVSWHFYGIDIVVRRIGENHAAGVLARHLLIETGTGIADRRGRRHNRFTVDLRGGVHFPFAGRHALFAGLVGQAAVTESGDRLHEVELFRTGGHNSVRGYTENEFAFKSVGYGQVEYLFYFSKAGSAYIFTDGGIGFIDRISLHDPYRTDLLGYGFGIRAPVRIGSASIEWGRSIADRKRFGRIHVRIRNTLSTAIDAW